MKSAMNVIDDIVSADEFYLISLMYLFLLVAFYFARRDALRDFIGLVIAFAVFVGTGTLYALGTTGTVRSQAITHYMFAGMIVWDVIRNKRYQALMRERSTRQILAGTTILLSYLFSIVISSFRIPWRPEYVCGVIAFIVGFLICHIKPKAPAINR